MCRVLRRGVHVCQECLACNVYAVKETVCAFCGLRFHTEHCVCVLSSQSHSLSLSQTHLTLTHDSPQCVSLVWNCAHSGLSLQSHVLLSALGTMKTTFFVYMYTKVYLTFTQHRPAYT